MLDSKKECCSKEKKRTTAIVWVCVCPGWPLGQWPTSSDWSVQSLKSQLVNEKLDVVSMTHEEQTQNRPYFERHSPWTHKHTHQLNKSSAQPQRDKQEVNILPHAPIPYFPLNLNPLQDQRNPDSSLVCVWTNFSFCAAALKSTSAGPMCHYRSGREEPRRPRLPKLSNIAGLSVMINKARRIFRAGCSRRMNDNHRGKPRPLWEPSL